MYKAVIIGCGRIGAQYDFDSGKKVISSHAGAYDANPKTELVAVCDLDIEKAKATKKKWDVPQIYTDYSAMLAEEKPDIISVCTWEDSHAKIIKDCVKFNPKAILCEKPIAADKNAAEEIINACKENGMLLQINYMRRFSPLYQEIAEFIRSGKLGKIQKIAAHYGNGLVTNGSHLIDLAHYFLEEEFDTIHSIKCELKSAYPNDPNFAVLAESKSGVIFSLLPQDNSKYLILEMKIFGEKGCIYLKNSGFEVEFFEPTAHSMFTGYFELRKVEPPFSQKEEGRFLEDSVRELLIAIENNKTPLCSGEDALKTLKFILKCQN